MIGLPLCATELDELWRGARSADDRAVRDARELRREHKTREERRLTEDSRGRRRKEVRMSLLAAWWSISLPGDGFELRNCTPSVWQQRAPLASRERHRFVAPENGAQQQPAGPSWYHRSCLGVRPNHKQPKTHATAGKRPLSSVEAPSRFSRHLQEISDCPLATRPLAHT